jgi:hypothetical protein
MSSFAESALQPRISTDGNVIVSARMEYDNEAIRKSFDHQPMGFTHNLHTLDLFKPDSLLAVAEKFGNSPRDYFIAGGAPTPGTKFYAVPNGGYKPVEALENLDRLSCRILLKRPENHDPRFRELMEVLFGQVIESLGTVRRDRVQRLESAIFISSCSTTTPVHFDPEVGFFSQIEGEKFYHVYPPDATRETEMERFYVRGRVDIGQVDLSGLDPAREHVFPLVPGKGFHQPQNSPHWVQTGSSRSVSYTFVFQTDTSRAMGRTRAFNYCLRKMGIPPSAPGIHPMADAVKAGTMRAAKPIQFLGRVINKTQRVLTGRRLPA